MALTVRFDVYHHFPSSPVDPSIEEALAQIQNTLSTILLKGEQMQQAMERLSTEVTESTQVMQSAATLIHGLADQIRELMGNPEALNALADELDSNANALAAAVAANTPADPEPPVDPEV